jgi:hypothetical protein
MTELTQDQYNFLVATVNARGALFELPYSYEQVIVGGSVQSHFWLYIKVSTAEGAAASTRKSPRDWLEDQEAFEAIIGDCLTHIERAIAH